MNSVWTDPHVWFPYALSIAIIFVLFVIMLIIMGVRPGGKGRKKGLGKK